MSWKYTKTTTRRRRSGWSARARRSDATSENFRKTYERLDRWRDEALYRFVLEGILKVQLNKLKIKHKRLQEEHEDSMLRV